MGESEDPHVQAIQSPEDEVETHKGKSANQEAVRQEAIPETKPLSRNAGNRDKKICPSLAMKGGKAFPISSLGKLAPTLHW